MDRTGGARKYVPRRLTNMSTVASKVVLVLGLLMLVVSIIMGGSAIHILSGDPGNEVGLGLIIAGVLIFHLSACAVCSGAIAMCVSIAARHANAPTTETVVQPQYLPMQPSGQLQPAIQADATQDSVSAAKRHPVTNEPPPDYKLQYEHTGTPPMQSGPP